VPVSEGHAISDQSEEAVMALFPAADVTAHLEPAGIVDRRLDDLVGGQAGR
jgi:divalent metal cation (Fe/Co/Zn/Cd) transporter